MILGPFCSTVTDFFCFVAKQLHCRPWGGGGGRSKKEILSAPLLTPAEKNLGATIRIVQEIWCLPYAGFFFFKMVELVRGWSVINGAYPVQFLFVHCQSLFYCTSNQTYNNAQHLNLSVIVWLPEILPYFVLPVCLWQHHSSETFCQTVAPDPNPNVSFCCQSTHSQEVCLP